MSAWRSKREREGRREGEERQRWEREREAEIMLGMEEERKDNALRMEERDGDGV